MFKFAVVLLAALACVSARPGVLHTPVVAAPIVHASVPVATSYQNVVRAPVVKSIHTVATVHSAPLIHAGPVVHAAPVAVAAPTIVKTHSVVAPVVHHAAAVPVVHHAAVPVASYAHTYGYKTVASPVLVH